MLKPIGSQYVAVPDKSDRIEALTALWHWMHTIKKDTHDGYVNFHSKSHDVHDFVRVFQRNYGLAYKTIEIKYSASRLVIYMTRGIESPLMSVSQLLNHIKPGLHLEELYLEFS